MPSISVRDEEILLAKRGVTTRCAIAAAIMSQVPAAKYITVTHDTISYLDRRSYERIVYLTPLRAAEFIDSWDRGQQVEPIKFMLNRILERRPPRQVSTQTRVKRDGPKPAKKPGSRMERPLRDQVCETP